MVLSWVSKVQIRPQTTYCGEAPRMHRRAAILSKAPVAVCGEENQQSCELGEFDHLWGPSAGPKRSKAELFQGNSVQSTFRRCTELRFVSGVYIDILILIRWVGIQPQQL